MGTGTRSLPGRRKAAVAAGMAAGVESRDAGGQAAQKQRKVGTGPVASEPRIRTRRDPSPLNNAQAGPAGALSPRLLTFDFESGRCVAPRGPFCVRTGRLREQDLSAGAGEGGVDDFPVGRGQLRVAFAQPTEALALIGEGLL